MAKNRRGPDVWRTGFEEADLARNPRGSPSQIQQAPALARTLFHSNSVSVAGCCPAYRESAPSIPIGPCDPLVMRAPAGPWWYRPFLKIVCQTDRKLNNAHFEAHPHLDIDPAASVLNSRIGNRFFLKRGGRELVDGFTPSVREDTEPAPPESLLLARSAGAEC